MLQRTYKIGEVASLMGLNPSVLRFWETEFPQLAPVRTKKGQRLYTDEHLERIARIKALLYEEKLTIDGARRRLAASGDERPLLRQIHDELTAIRKMLDA
jgi:DNA-binding transcriptional MerR regulator